MIIIIISMTLYFIEINCIEKVGWSQDLTDTVLDNMMTIFKGKAWSNVFIPPVTYIFAPECPKLSTKGHVYVSGGGNHAEDNMAAHCGLPTEFYLTSAPCPDCAMMLYNAYNNKPKPTIHIACRYQGKGKEGSEGNLNVNLHCLAMLMNAGFTLTPWNWSTFKDNYINNNDCKNSLKDMIDDMKYQDRYEKIDAAIKKANVMSGDHFQICSNAAKNGK